MLLLVYDCTNADFQKIITLLKSFLQVLQIVIPIGLIIMGTIDLGKAVISSNEDDIKKGQKAFMKRCLAAVLVFLVVTIVNFVTGFVGGTEWSACWAIDTITNSAVTNFVA